MFSGFGGTVSAGVRLKKMQLALVTILIRERNKVEADWCKRTIILENERCKGAIILANYKQQVTLGQVSDLVDKN